MSWWWRLMLGVAVALMPGGFMLLLGWMLVQALRRKWLEARQKALSEGATVSLRAVLAEVRLNEVVREARARL